MGGALPAGKGGGEGGVPLACNENQQKSVCPKRGKEVGGESTSRGRGMPLGGGGTPTERGFWRAKLTRRKLYAREDKTGIGTGTHEKL